MAAKTTLYEIEKNGKRIPVSEKELVRRSGPGNVGIDEQIFPFSYVFVNGERMLAKNVPVLTNIIVSPEDYKYGEIEGLSNDSDPENLPKIFDLIGPPLPETSTEQEQSSKTLLEIVQTERSEKSVLEQIRDRSSDQSLHSLSDDSLFGDLQKEQKERQQIEEIENAFVNGISEEMFSSALDESVPTEPEEVPKIIPQRFESEEEKEKKIAVALENYRVRKELGHKKMTVNIVIYTVLAILILAIIPLALHTRIFEDLSQKIRSEDKAKTESIDQKSDNTIPSESSASSKANGAVDNSKSSKKANAVETSTEKKKKNLESVPNKSSVKKQQEGSSIKAAQNDLSKKSNSTDKGSPKEDKPTPSESVPVKNKSTGSAVAPIESTSDTPSSILNTPNTPKVQSNSDKSKDRQSPSSSDNSSKKENQSEESKKQASFRDLTADWKGNLDFWIIDKLAGRVNPEIGKLVWGSRVGSEAVGPKGNAKTAVLIDGHSQRIVYKLDQFPQEDFILNLDFLIENFPEKGSSAKLLSAACALSDDPVAVEISKDQKILGKFEGHYKSGDTVYEFLDQTNPIPIDLDKWHKLNIVKKSGILYFFLDGDLLLQPIRSSEEKTKTTKIALGGNPILDEYLNCRIANFILAVPKPKEQQKK